jgi:hypothetical protein
VLEQIIPDVEAGLSLSEVRARIKKLQSQVDALKRVPVPASDIEQKVRNYVERLPMPIIGGIVAGEALTVQWPTGLQALLAFVEPDVLAERLMGEIDRIANTPFPLAQRERKIAELAPCSMGEQRRRECIHASRVRERDQALAPKAAIRALGLKSLSHWLL